MCCVCTVLFSFKSQLDGGEMCCVCTVLFSFKSQLDGEKCAVFAQYFLRSRASSTGRNVMCPRASSTGRNVLCLHNTFSFKSQLDGEKCAVFAQYFSFKSQLDGEKCAVFAQYFFRSRASSTVRNVLCLHSTFLVQGPHSQEPHSNGSTSEQL